MTTIPTQSNVSQTTVSRLTAGSPSAIAVLEVAGPRAVDIVQQCWRPNQGSNTLSLNRIRYGCTLNSSQEPGESIVVCRTEWNRIEIHCHGGRMASDQIVRELVRHGAVEQSAAESIGRELDDEIANEAREDLTRASTHRSTSILLDQMRGALGNEFRSIGVLMNSKQYSEAGARLRLLLGRYAVGRHLIAPWVVVLAGPPNVGKSSLLNLLLGYSRAIVHEQAGTTRDLLSERSSLDGWPIEIVDGAGIRDREMAGDAIEAMGIERTLLRIGESDCLLLLVDSVSGWTKVHESILSHPRGHTILVLTKSDLAIETTSPRSSQLAQEIAKLDSDGRVALVVETSAVTGFGLEKLMETIVAELVPQSLQPGDAVPFRKRHLDWIETTLAKIP
jgi:tRNA modification GTPase